MKFIAEKYLTLLKGSALDTFNNVWAHKMAWFEEPNVRRGGWSGVGRFSISHQNGEQLNVFLKKQQNHTRINAWHPLTKEPTFRREFAHLQFLEKKKFLAPEVVFYAESLVDQANCAVLMTRALDGFQPLDDFLKDPQTHRVQWIKKIAQEVRRFHALGLVHRALYPKHIFVMQVENTVEVAVIDLEKSRPHFFLWYAAFFDLAALNRHTMGLRRTLRMHFFLTYMQIDTLDVWRKLLLRQILRRSRR